MSNNITTWLAFITVCLLSSMSYAGDIPNAQKSLSIVSKEQRVTDFLQEFFAQLDLPVAIQDDIKGNINSSFLNKPAGEIINTVARTFGFVAYYDGLTVYVYHHNAVRQEMISANQGWASNVVTMAKDEGWVDAKNRIKVVQNGSLLVTGVPRFHEQIDELITLHKKPSSKARARVRPSVAAPSKQGFKVFYLKYAWAQDMTTTIGGRSIVLPGIASTLRRLMGKEEQYSQPLADNNHPVGLKGQGLSRHKNNDVAPVNNSHSSITADPRLNAVIVRDAPHLLSQYETLIEALDVESETVEIEATIIDVNVSKMRDLGVDWRGTTNRPGIVEGSSTLEVNNSLGGAISYMTGKRGLFEAQIKALEQDGVINVVSSPHILTLSNVEAVFDNSSTFYVRVQGEEEVDLFDITAGTVLRVTPHVFNDNEGTKIKLLVNIEDGKRGDIDRDVDSIPTVDRSFISTQALINSNESMLIGGLVRETTTETEKKVPILGDIPLLGYAFKSKQKGGARIERMFLISPRLSNQYHLDQPLDLERDQQVMQLSQPDSKKTLLASNADTPKAVVANTADRAKQHYLEPIREVAASYPERALLNGEEGECELSFMIDEQGQPNTIVATDCEHEGFRSAAIGALKEFQYDTDTAENNVSQQQKTFVFAIND